MWLYMIAIVLLVAGVIGGLLTGGIFTIVVLPLGVIVLIAAFVTGMWGRSSGASSHDVKSEAKLEPADLPHTNRPQPGTAGTTAPEDLVDARRRAQ